MTTRPAIDRAITESANLEWLLAAGDEVLSRERHSMLLLEISGTVTTIASDLHEHVAHPTAHTPHRAYAQTGADALRAIPARYPKSTLTAAGTSAGAVTYGLIEVLRALLGS